MAEKLPTPSCEVSGLPLSVLPLEPRAIGALSFAQRVNAHHHFHPEKSPELRTLAGLALRKSRIQMTPVLAHNEYHKLYEGPSLPEGEAEIFRLCVLAVAGIVPRRAIDPISPNLTIELSDSLHAQIARSTRIDQPRDVARFLAQYCAGQETDYDLIELLTDKKASPEDRLYVARELLGFSIESALGNLVDQHRDIKKERLVRSFRAPSLYSVTRGLIRRHALKDFTEQLISVRLAS